MKNLRLCGILLFVILISDQLRGADITSKDKIDNDKNVVIKTEHSDKKEVKQGSKLKQPLITIQSVSLDPQEAMIKAEMAKREALEKEQKQRDEKRELAEKAKEGKLKTKVQHLGLSYNNVPLKEDKNSNYSVSVNGKNTNKSELKIKPFKLNKKMDYTTLDPIKKKLQEKNINFNFPNTDLKIFARYVAKLNGLLLIGENKLKGRVSLKTEKAMNLNDLMECFGAILENNGLEYKMNEYYMSVLPKTDAVVEVYKLNYMKASEIASELQRIFQSGFRSENNKGTIEITSIKATNSLIVVAPMSQQVEIARAIKKLDFRTKQVMLEFKIIEVTRDGTFGFSMDFIGSAGSSTFGLGSDGAGITTIPSGAQTFGSAGANASYLLNSKNVQLDIQATDKITNIKLLSQPRLLTAENEKSEIKIGNKTPIVSSTTQLSTGSSSGNANVSSSITYKDIGITLNVVPRINFKKDVTLEINMVLTAIISEVKVNQSGEQNSVPVIGHRTIQNTATVMDGDILVLGGLLKNTKTKSVEKPPILGDIPYLGWLLSSITETSSQVELIVFIKPTVIETPEDGRAVTRIETEKIRNYDTDKKSEITSMLLGMKTKNDNEFDVNKYLKDTSLNIKENFTPPWPNDGWYDLIYGKGALHKYVNDFIKDKENKVNSKSK